MMLIMGVASTIEAGLETNILKIHAQDGSFAESVLSSNRTVHAFGLRTRLVGEFDQFLSEAHRLGKKKKLLFGCMFSAEYFVMFAGMGLCFWQAIGMLARGEVEDPGDTFM